MRHRSAISHSMESVVGAVLVAYIADMFQLYVSPAELLELIETLFAMALSRDLAVETYGVDGTVVAGFVLLSVAVAYTWGYLFHMIFLDE